MRILLLLLLLVVVVVVVVLENNPSRAHRPIFGTAVQTHTDISGLKKKKINNPSKIYLDDISISILYSLFVTKKIIDKQIIDLPFVALHGVQNVVTNLCKWLPPLLLKRANPPKNTVTG